MNVTGGGGAVDEWVGLATGWSIVQIPLRQLIRFGSYGNSVYPALPGSFGGDTKSRRSLLYGVYMPGEVKYPTSLHWTFVTCRGLHHPTLRDHMSSLTTLEISISCVIL